MGHQGPRLDWKVTRKKGGNIWKSQCGFQDGVEGRSAGVILGRKAHPLPLVSVQGSFCSCPLGCWRFQGSGHVWTCWLHLETHSIWTSGTQEHAFMHLGVISI